MQLYYLVEKNQFYEFNYLHTFYCYRIKRDEAKAEENNTKFLTLTQIIDDLGKNLSAALAEHILIWV